MEFLGRALGSAFTGAPRGPTLYSVQHRSRNSLYFLGPCIHSPAILQACANGPLAPDTELGSWVDSESKEMVSRIE